MNASASVHRTDDGALFDDLQVPEFPRILYDKNPLEYVICQLRFPPILKIEAELPSSFQEAVRQQFPLFSEARPQVGIAPGMPADFSKLLGAMLPASLPRIYEFASPDRVWQITLTRDSLALTCRRYKRWEEFRGLLKIPLDALLENYSPAFLSRIGLRYRDLICRSELGLDDVPWNELLTAELAGEFHSPFKSNIAMASHQIVLNLSGGKAQALIQHGITPKQELPLGQTVEVCYYIDNDFFTQQRKETNNVLETLDYFSKHSWRLFRWCIAERLHNAMGPQPIPTKSE